MWMLSLQVCIFEFQIFSKNLMISCRPSMPSDVNKIVIQNDPSDDASWSFVGNQRTGIQKLEISDWGFDNRTLPHELLHATGIYHEQSRPDRDKFVEIHENCISNGEEHNFYKHSTSHTYGLEYNPKSIMHYRKTAFSRKSGCRTITSKARTVEYENSNISCD